MLWKVTTMSRTTGPKLGLAKMVTQGPHRTVFVGPHFHQLPVRTTIETLGWWTAVTVRSAGPPKHLVERNFVELVEVTDIVAGQPAAPGRSEFGRARSRHPDFAHGAEPEAAGRGGAGGACAWPRTTRGFLLRPAKPVHGKARTDAGGHGWHEHAEPDRTLALRKHA